MRHDYDRSSPTLRGTRLISVVTYIADLSSHGITYSNACKFTPTGGKLIISTKLVAPSPSKYALSVRSESTHRTEASNVTTAAPTQDATDRHSLSASHLSQHNLHHSKPHTPLEWIVVRIEVTDTGCGIKPKDIAQSKLFCKFSPVI
jgi:osomolarity two-component system, sensor histidine kinase SLN1